MIHENVCISEPETNKDSSYNYLLYYDLIEGCRYNAVIWNKMLDLCKLPIVELKTRLSQLKTYSYLYEVTQFWS